MSYREGPKTIDQLVAYIDERLRNVDDSLRFRGPVNLGAGLSITGSLTGGYTIGTVMSIQWTAVPITCTVLLDDGTTLTDVRYTTPFPPPPTSRALLWQGADTIWRAVGVDGGRREIFHDDFTRAPIAFTQFASLAGSTLGSIGQDVAIGAMNGAVAITTTTTQNQYVAIGSDDHAYFLPSDRVLWASFKFLFRQTTHLFQIGLMHSGVGDFSALAAGEASVRIVSDANASFPGTGVPASTLGFWVNNGTALTGISTDIPLVADKVYTCDLAVVGGLWAAAWVNGTGPFILRSNVPCVGGSTPGVSPGMGVFNRPIGAAGTLICDWFHVEELPVFVAPT